MKMVKSLLLGSAAGLVAVAGAQAADLPVKAKPVEYVKICSLYGEGFFYIPGTDTCIKIGGWVRAEFVTNAAGSFSEFLSGTGGRNNRIDSKDLNMRARTVVSFDTRTQTEYGTLRTYYRNGFELTTDAMGGGQGTYYTERAFIQFAGFTLGKSQSYFDFYNGVFGYGLSYLGGGGSNTGASGTVLAAYTAQFGSGFSATISAEDNTYRRNAVWDAGTNALAIGAFPGPNGWTPVGYATCGVSLTTPDGNNNVTNNAGAPAILGTNVVGCATGDYAAQQVPDIVGSLRVDQAWGSAQIAGALHQVRTGYYGNNFTNTLFVGPGGYTGVAPEDKWGYALMAGAVINLPWAQGDKFWIEAAYTVGATQYAGCAQTGVYGNFLRFNGNTVGQGQCLDALFANTIGPATPTAAGVVAAPSGVQLTKIWTIAAAIEHYWTPGLRSDLFASYMETDFNATATTIYCSSPVGAARTAAGAAPNFATGAVIGCNPDFKVWGIGLRTIWNPVKNLDVGFEVMYAKLDQNMDPTTTRWNFGGAGGRPAGLFVPADQDIWSGGIRVQRNFWP
jgi:Porin subfamily